MTKTKRKKPNLLPSTPPIPPPLREEGGLGFEGFAFETSEPHMKRYSAKQMIQQYGTPDAAEPFFLAHVAILESPQLAAALRSLKV